MTEKELMALTKKELVKIILDQDEELSKSEKTQELEKTQEKDLQKIYATVISAMTGMKIKAREEK